MKGELCCCHECPTTSTATLDDGVKRASYSGNTKEYTAGGGFIIVPIAPHFSCAASFIWTCAVDDFKYAQNKSTTVLIGVSHRYAREDYQPTSVDCVARNLHNVVDTHCRRVGSVLIPGCWTGTQDSGCSICTARSKRHTR